jgi:hypothetical protein
LAFHPYPQVIRAVFNPHRFGPPLGVTPASPCPWVDRPGFGSAPPHSRALVTGLAFAAAPLDTSLASRGSSNSPDHNAKGTQSAVGRLPAPSLLPLVGMWFQVLFHSPPRGAFHLSLTVLVHYRSHGSPLALEGGPPSFAPDYSGRALLRNTASRAASPSPTGLSPSSAPRSRGVRLASTRPSAGPTTPPS